MCKSITMILAIFLVVIAGNAAEAWDWNCSADKMINEGDPPDSSSASLLNVDDYNYVYCRLQVNVQEGTGLAKVVSPTDSSELYLSGSDSDIIFDYVACGPDARVWCYVEVSLNLFGETAYAYAAYLWGGR